MTPGAVPLTSNVVSIATRLTTGIVVKTFLMEQISCGPVNSPYIAKMPSWLIGASEAVTVNWQYRKLDACRKLKP